jgi:ATP-dependent RNA helicase HelY
VVLDKFQEDAISYIRNGHSVLVSAPTGAGKTLIAECVIEECVKNGFKVIYTSPVKALSNQKYRDFSGTYGDKLGILTGDVSINPDASVVIMTTEILRNRLLENPSSLENHGWVIFDEIHYIDDAQRGTVWEESIMYLPKHIRILALSATIPNVHELAGWLSSIHKHKIYVVEEKKRPVQLKFYFQCGYKLIGDVK